LVHHHVVNSLGDLFHTWQQALVLWALVLATGGLLAAVRTLWRATVGKSRFFIVRYRRLAVSARHEYVKGLFGESAWEHHARVGSVEQVEPDRPRRWSWRSRHPVQQREPGVEVTVRVWPLGKIAYLTTWCTDSDEVAAFSLTTRSRWFRPRISIGPDHTITLGKSHLADLPAQPAPTGNRYAAVGARRTAYAEEHYFGNGGQYQTWFVGVCDAGYPVQAPIGVKDDDGAWDEEQMAQYRAGAVINSVLVCGMGALWVPEVLPYGIGPDLDAVRLMDANTPLWTRWRQQRHRRRLTRELRRSIESGQA
jgi:hypothetical protein